MINEKKDACYHKVKSRYSVWPSAYASGALVKCRKKGAKNWGNSRKDEALHTAYKNFIMEAMTGPDGKGLSPEDVASAGMNARAKKADEREQRIKNKKAAIAAKQKKQGPSLISRASQTYKKFMADRKEAAEQKAIKKGEAERKNAEQKKYLQGKAAEEKAEIARQKRVKAFGKNRKKVENRRLARVTMPLTPRGDRKNNSNDTSPELRSAAETKRREDALAARKNITINPNDADERRTDDDRRKELRQRLKDKIASEQEARAAARGTTRRKITYDIGIDPKTGERGIISKKQGGLSYLGRLTRAKTQQAVDSPLKSLKGLKRATIGSPTSAIKAGRAAMKARRERIDFSTEYQKIGSIIAEKSAAWTRSEGKNPSGGLNAKGVASYRAQNPGSKLKTAVTTKPSKLKKGSKAANRRKSFCARMKGMRKRQKSSNNTGKDRLSLSLKKWNC